jgi:hypothetical protein
MDHRREQLDADAGRIAINAMGQFVPAGSWLPIIFTANFPSAASTR